MGILKSLCSSLFFYYILLVFVKTARFGYRHYCKSDSTLQSLFLCYVKWQTSQESNCPTLGSRTQSLFLVLSFSYSSLSAPAQRSFPSSPSCASLFSSALGLLAYLLSLQGKDFGGGRGGSLGLTAWNGGKGELPLMQCILIEDVPGATENHILV